MTRVFRPRTTHARLGPDFYDPVHAADFPQTILRFRNDRWAPAVGLGDLDDGCGSRTRADILRGGSGDRRRFGGVVGGVAGAFLRRGLSGQRARRPDSQAPTFALTG